MSWAGIVAAYGLWLRITKFRRDFGASAANAIALTKKAVVSGAKCGKIKAPSR
jgi:hypothetical protein